MGLLLGERLVADLVNQEEVGLAELSTPLVIG